MSNFTILGYKKWTEEDIQVLKQLFIEGRKADIPHRRLWRDIALKLRRSPSEIQRRMVRLYQTDPELLPYKQENWSKDKILDQLKKLYLENAPLNKSALPQKLKFTLLKSVPPAASGDRAWFQSPDDAIAEAILSVGYCRNEDGTLDKDSPIRTKEEALEYVRNGIKKRHDWTIDEVRDVLASLNACDYPITLPFLTNHHDIYKTAIKSNRKLESFKDVVKRFVEAGIISSYADLVCSIAPDYKNYYNQDFSRLKLSTEEIRVKKFLDRYKIPYLIPRLSEKIETGMDRFANFVPDFILLDKDSKPRAIIEVFGSIGDRENSGVNELYNAKTEAKIEFYKGLGDVDFIEIHNNQGRCDLDDDSLFSRFGRYIGLNKQAHTDTKVDIIVESFDDLLGTACSDGNWNANPYLHGMANGLILGKSVVTRVEPEFLEAPKTYLSDLSDLVATNVDDLIFKISRYGSAISYVNNKYRFVSAAQNFEFDSLLDLPEINSSELKKIFELIEHSRMREKYPSNTKNVVETVYDYSPRTIDIFNDSNRDISIELGEDGSGPTK